MVSDTEQLKMGHFTVTLVFQPHIHLWSRDKCQHKHGLRIVTEESAIYGTLV